MHPLREQLTRRAKQHPRIAIACAAVLIGCVVIVVVSGILWIVKGGGPQPLAPQPQPQAHEQPSARDWLTGLPSAAAPERPFAVMIENHSEARPQSGLSRAALVFEAPVEGGITRFLAVFSASSSVSEIGPVRSARPYYVDWANELDADYVHVGGSPEAVARINSFGILDADEFAWGRFFWRSDARSAPHNVYTSTRLLHDMRVAREFAATSTAAGWRFANAPVDHPTSTPNLTIEFSSVIYRVEWRYDAASNTYQRFISGAQDIDADGTPITANNIVVLRTETQVLDAVGRLKLRTLGTGKAWVFLNGRRTEVRWKKPTAGERLRFETVDGKEIYFTPGTTWVEVTTADMPVTHGVRL